MKNVKPATAATLTAIIAATVLVPTAGASAQTGPSTPAMQHAATSPTPNGTGERQDPRGVGGVAKALYAGFKAATSPRDAAKVLSWASVVGRSSLPNGETADLEADYFDR